jgi:hypothetical protein
MEGNEMINNNYSPAYILDWDDSHLLDIDYDAFIVKFSGWENTIRLSLTREYDLPNTIKFDAIFDTLKNTDFPITNVRWPIFSNQIWEILKELQSFPHKEIPVVMVDCQVVSDGQGSTKVSGTENDNFIAVQLLEHLDLLDWENSIVEPSFILPDQIMGVQKLVLKETTYPLPPLFRLSAYPTALLASSQARMALEQAGIKGVVFKEIENFQA